MFWMMSRVCGSIEIGPRGLVQLMPFIAVDQRLAAGSPLVFFERLRR